MKLQILTDEEVAEIVARCDDEYSKVSCPMPVSLWRYEIAVAQAQLDKIKKHIESQVDEAAQMIRVGRRKVGAGALADQIIKLLLGEED